MKNPLYQSAFKAGLLWRTYLRLRRFYYRYCRWRRKGIYEK